MPRDGSNVYTQPFPNVAPSTTIASTVYNGFTNDVAQDLNAPRPIVAGGTGANNADTALFNLSAAKAAQLVTNYDTQLWVPGSFYSATTATGEPVDGQAFSGIAYINEALANPPTNANVTVEARSLTDGRLYIRRKVANVWGSWLLEDDVSGATAAIALKVAKAGDTMTGPLVLPAAAPTLGTHATNKTYVDAADAALTTLVSTCAPLRGYLGGLTLSTAGGSTSFGITTGGAADTTSTSLMSLTSAYTKTTGAWVVGSGNGALDTGSIASSTMYYVYLIRRPDTGVVDVCISTSFSTPTLGGAIPAAYTQFRRIGAMITNASSQWSKFYQNGDEFLWDVPFQDANALAVGTSGVLVLVAAPPLSEVIFNHIMQSNTASTVLLAHSTLTANQVAGTPLGNYQLWVEVANGVQAGQTRLRVSAARQIRLVSNATVATCVNHLSTIAYVDRRGRDD